MKIECGYCKKKTDKPKGAINRAKKRGMEVYCDRQCAGLGRRVNRTEEEKKQLKMLYDIEYRKNNQVKLKSNKHEWFKKTYDPAKAAIRRKKNMKRHIAYCQQPEYRKWKKEYDVKYLAKKKFGEFWESAILVNKIEAEYDAREVRQINNLHNKSLKRKRLWHSQRQN